MVEIRKPKIGLAGVMSTPFRGDKEGNYSRDREVLENLAAEFDFEFLAAAEGVYNLEQAQNTAASLQSWGADFVLLQTSSFAAGEFFYPFTDLFPRLGLWAVPEGPPSAEGGLPLNSFTASNMYNSIIRTRLKDLTPPKWFFGGPEDPLFQQRLEVTVQALRTIRHIYGRKVGLFGGVAPGFDNLIVDPQKLKNRLGIEILEISFEDLLQRTKAVADQEAIDTAKRIRAGAAHFEETQDTALYKSARVVCAVEKMMDELELSAAAISCWPRFQSDYDLAICSVMGYLNQLGRIAACEGDVTSAVSMLMLQALTNGDPVTLMDLVSLDPKDESALLWHCGPTPSSLANSEGVSMGSMWLFDGEDGKRTGLHNDLVLKPGPASLIGFTVDYEQMLVAAGEIDDQKPSYKGSRGWIKDLKLNDNEISLQDFAATIMASGFQHHYPLAYGNLSGAALELAAWLDINPVLKTTYTDYKK
jgi:hypothetical protein